MTEDRTDLERSGPDGLDRRRFLGQLGLGSAVAAGAWVTPSIVGVHAAAAATVRAPDIIEVAQAFTAGDGDTVEVTLTEAPEAGDLLVAIFATNTNTDSIAESSAPTPLPFTEAAQANRGNPSGVGIETVESWILTRLAGASEPMSYSFSRTSGFAVNKRGLRVVLLVVRGTSGLTTAPASATPGANPQDFPTVAATAHNLVVHAGVGGSWNHISRWMTQPAGALVTRYDANPAGADSPDRRPMIVTQLDQAAAGTTAATSADLDGVGSFLDSTPYSVTWTMAFAPT